MKNSFAIRAEHGVVPFDPRFRDNCRMVGKRYRLKWSMTAFEPKPTAAESDIRLPVDTMLTVTGVRDENDLDAVTSDGKSIIVLASLLEVCAEEIAPKEMID